MRKGTFFGRCFAHAGVSAPAEPEVRGNVILVPYSPRAKGTPFSRQSSWGFAGVVLPPAEYRAPCGGSHPRRPRKNDSSSSANPSESL